MTNEELDSARAEEAWNIYNRDRSGDVSAIAARLAREGWTPPKVVDPDREEAITLAKKFGLAHYIPVLDGIKRGRALAAAEVKPGMVWVKHDGSTICPVDRDAWVLTKNFGYTPCFSMGKRLAWQTVTHYAIITPPTEDVA